MTLVETGLQLDTGAVLSFGEDGESVIDEISSVLGDPDTESDFEQLEFCSGERQKFVTWGQLEIVVEEDAGGDARFVEWFADGATDPVGLVTVDGLGVGATVGFLQVNYGSTLQLDAAVEGSEEGVFAVVNTGSGGTLVGITSGLDATDTVRSLWAGDGCQRLAAL